uniref:Interferon-induced protein 44-like n=1 Tax=Cyprinus carpio carpio TaxID=630221 RepID=A0A9J7ZTF5_CYPCA
MTSLFFSCSLQVHIQHVRRVLQRLLENQLFAKAEKCSFHNQSVPFLGHIISVEGICMDPAKSSEAAVPSVQAFISRCRRTWRRAREALLRTRECTKRLADRRRAEAPRYICGQRVWLSTKNLPLKVPFKKLAPRFIGPYPIVKCNTYKMKKGEAGFFYPFTFTDIAGIHNQSNSIMANDIHRLLNGHIIDGYTFNPVSSITEDDPKYKRNPILKDRIHCLVAVLPAITVSLMHEEVFAQMRAVREKARDLGIPQAIIMTKVDEACPLVKENLEKIYKSKRIKQKMDDCSSRLGVPMSFIYPVKNYHEEHAINVKMDVLILDALQNIVNFANDYVEAHT